MTKGKDTNIDLTRLEQVLDIFGSDPDRWPTAERDGLEALVDGEARARHLVGEARALERTLDSATVALASDALKALIVVAAISDTTRNARVVPIDTARSRPGRSFSVRRGVSVMWPAAALAASFALGVYLGVAGIGERAFPGSLQMASITSPLADGDVIPWIEENIGPEAEDLL